MPDTDHTIPYHIPALLIPSLEGLITNPDGIYVDATFGGGGHARAILERLGDKGRLLAFDQDAAAFANRPEDPRFIFVHSNFRYLKNFLRYHGIDRIDGLLADLGVSFHHFDDPERGFSFRQEAPLDMRMNREAPCSASTLLAEISAEELQSLLKTHTDLKRSRDIAAAIIAARQASPVDTTTRLADIVMPLLNPKAQKKDLAQVFQALRIAVNGEMDALAALLRSSVEVIRPGGRLAVISYHSGEDRMVKNFMKTGRLDGDEDTDIFGHSLSPWRLVTRTPIVPSEEEIEANPRSRSAKLRVAQRTDLPWPPAERV